MKQNLIIGAIAVIALVIGVTASIKLSAPADPVYAQMYPAPRALHAAELTVHDGTSINNDWFKSQWTLVFLGFTWCPDICPTTLAELKGIYPQLQSLQDDTPIKVLFLSVDPNRDTVERLNEYINFFHSDFTAATAPHKVLFPLVRSMGMAYAIADSTDNPDYLIDHSASVVVINPDGNMVGRFKPVHEPGEMAISDGEQILADMPLIMSL
jgi:protein SCO1/2